MRGEPRLDKLRDKTGKVISPNHYIVYFDGERSRRVSTGYRIGEEDSEAQIALAQFILERERPQAREPSQLMIVHALKDYYKEHIQYTASKKNAPYYEKYLTDFWGVSFVSDITQGKIDRFVREQQARNMSNGTIRRILEHMQGALSHANREQRLTYVPKFKKPEAPEPRDEILTPKQIEKLLDACKSDHIRSFIILMMETNQRPGAIEGLTWFQVDFANRIINFDRVKKPKSNKRVRPVAMSDTAYSLLTRLHKIKQTEYVLEYTPNFGVNAIPAGCVKKAFERACIDAGLRPVKGGGVSRYTLRHTAIDWLDEVGISDKDSADIAGHTNAKTTRRHYIKTKIKRQRKLLNRASKLRAKKL